MLFPDPRSRSPTALGRFGLTFACDDVTTAMNRLSSDLSQASAAGLLITHWFTANEGHPTAVAAQSVYDSINNGSVVIESSDACAQYAQQANDAADAVESLLQSKNTSSPNYVPPTTNPYANPSGASGQLPFLDQLKPIFIAVAIGAGALVLIPLVGELAGWSKVARASKKRVSGYGRRGKR